METIMHIDFKTEGGVAYFPGLSKPFTLDSNSLPAAQAEQLQQLVTKARLLEQPNASKAAKSTARTRAVDGRRYTITLEEDGHKHTLQFADPITDPDVQALVDFLNDARRPT